MENFARVVLNNAQTLYDGGVIGNILRDVKLLNNSNLKNDIMPYMMSLRMSGGYVAGLVFGISWMLILIVLTAFFCLYHFKEPRKRTIDFKLKKIKGSSYSKATILQLFAIGAVVVPVLLLICLSVVNVAYLGHAISSPASNYEPNKSESVTSMLPAITKSLSRARHYLSTFASDARVNTASTVEDIIAATKYMQNETMTKFNGILMRRIGVTDTFRHGDEMTRIVVMFFEKATALVEAKKDYDALHSELYPSSIKRSTGVFRFIELLETSVAQLEAANLCDSECVATRDFFKRNFQPDDSFANTEFASSFLFVMKQRNETSESVKAKSAHGRRQMAKTMAKTKKRMEALVDIAGTVRNMTGASWTKMDVEMSAAVGLIDRVTLTLASDQVSAKASRYSAILVVVLLLPLLFALAVVVLTVALVCFDARNMRLRFAVYACLSVLSISLLFAMLTFLVGGKMETELCRYIRTQQPIVVGENGSSLVLDTHINAFLGRTLPILARTKPKRDFPLPQPHNALYGLVHRCRNNEPILAAIDAIRSMDASALSKPEASAKIVAVGRMLLLESLNETDPKKMMPADMADSLKQAAQMDMFKKIDVAANIAKIPQSPFSEQRAGVSVPIPTRTFVERVDKFIRLYGAKLKVSAGQPSLEQEFEQLLKLVERFNLLTDRARLLFQEVERIPQIEPVVTRLQASLATMLALMNNKTRLLEVADRLYEVHIVASTPENSAKIMARFGPRMMAQLGHCRPIYEAYAASVDTACDVVVSKLNTYWLYLGSVVLLLTVFLAMVLAAVVGPSAAPGTPPDTHANLDEKKAAGEPLVPDPSEQGAITRV